MDTSEANPAPGTPRGAAERRKAFRMLHQSGCFVIPNPWAAGSALYLRHLGFRALATTSAGFALSRGLPDHGVVTAAMMLRHVAEIVSAVDLPVNADFQEGFSATPEGVAENVRLCVETGVAGLSIEDATGNSAKPLYELSEAVERVTAALARAAWTGFIRAAAAIAGDGAFGGFSDLVPLAELERVIRALNGR